MNIPTREVLKSMHLKQILLSAAAHGEVSRTTLCNETGLSAPAITFLVTELIDAGLLRESDELEKSSGGRPRKPLSVVGDRLYVPVAELTRDGAILSVFALDGRRVYSERVPYDRPLPGITDERLTVPASELFGGGLYPALAALPERYKSSGRLILSFPGNYHKAREALYSSVMNVKLTCRLYEELEAVCGLEPYLGNVADFLAYSERVAGGTSDSYIYLYIGVGVGSGLIQNGVPFEVNSVRAGEFGHISVDYNGLKCSCGNYGCIERYLSRGALFASAQNAGFTFSGADPDARMLELAAAYEAGDAAICALFDDVIRKLLSGLYNLLAIFPCDNIIFGGGIELLGAKFLDAVRETSKVYGNRNLLENASIRYTSVSADNAAYGAFRYYCDQLLDIERLIPRG